MIVNIGKKEKLFLTEEEKKCRLLSGNIRINSNILSRVTCVPYLYLIKIGKSKTKHSFALNGLCTQADLSNK